MVGRIPRTLWLQVGLIATGFPSLAVGQMLAHDAISGYTAMDVASEMNASCGLSSCPPQAFTYGYFHEHWRRWPEEAQSKLPGDVLSPFARPSREVPVTRPPDATEEESMAPPRRGQDSAATDSGTTGRSTAPAVPPARPATPLPNEGARDREPDLPLVAPPDRSTPPLDELEQPSTGSGFFPSDADDETGPAPEVFPDSDLDTTLPPIDLDERLPGDGLDVLPPDNDADDVFDLDAFSQVNPRRLQRYRMSSSGQMRRSQTTSRARENPHAAALSRQTVQLAAYRRASGGRNNPLRSSGGEKLVLSYTVPSQSHSPGWNAEPVDVEPVEYEVVPLEWTEPERSMPRSAGRSNPLR